MTKESHSISARDSVKRYATGELNSASNCHKGSLIILIFFVSFLPNLQHKWCLTFYNARFTWYQITAFPFSVITCPGFQFLVYPSLKVFSGQVQGLWEALADRRPRSRFDDRWWFTILDPWVWLDLLHNILSIMIWCCTGGFLYN